MAFVSYAQNFEDIMLWRALKHVHNGFYIDIGAWSPDLDSVTRAFYERNWRGISIEPNPEFYTELVDKRPRDINLCLAVSDTIGEREFNLLSNPGLSTLDDTIAQKHREAGWLSDRRKVKVSTLAEICRAHVPLEQEIHFLKIDVEGMEESVIRGNDWAEFRPWIVVVEATQPMSRQENYAAWEHLLLSADYRFSYADGLNRFYVAAEHGDLAEAWVYPPNVFDEFVLSAQLRAEARAEEADAGAEQANARAEEAEARAEQAIARAEQAEARTQQLLRSLEQVYATRSWRMTAPLRWIFHQAMKLFHQGPGVLCGEFTKRVTHSLFIRLIAIVDARPRLHLLCVRISRKLGLYQAMLPIYVRLTEQANARNTGHDFEQDCIFPQAVHQLTPGARKIFGDLRTAIAAKHGKSN